MRGNKVENVSNCACKTSLGAGGNMKDTARLDTLGGKKML